MKHTALLVFLFACNEPSKKQPPPTAEPSRVDACASALVSFGKFIDTGDPAAPADQHAKVKSAVQARCLADHWSDDALACMRGAGNSHEIFACWNDKLTKEQREAASKALGDLKM